MSLIFHHKATDLLTEQRSFLFPLIFSNFFDGASNQMKMMKRATIPCESKRRLPNRILKTKFDRLRNFSEETQNTFRSYPFICANTSGQCFIFLRNCYEIWLPWLAFHFFFVSRKKDYPKDVVILFQTPQHPKTSTMSPFAAKLEMYLRMAKIPYQVSWQGKHFSKTFM